MEYKDSILVYDEHNFLYTFNTIYGKVSSGLHRINMNPKPFTQEEILSFYNEAKKHSEKFINLFESKKEEILNSKEEYKKLNSELEEITNNSISKKKELKNKLSNNIISKKEYDKEVVELKNDKRKTQNQLQNWLYNLLGNESNLFEYEELLEAYKKLIA